MATATLPLTRPASGTVPALRARERLMQVLCTLEAWSERWQQRRELQQISDAALRDIGLSRADVAAEAAKPFWRS